MTDIAERKGPATHEPVAPYRRCQRLPDGAPRRDRNGLEILDRSSCLRLLTTVPIGRLAYVCGGVVRIIPINVSVDRDTLLFRLSTGNALAAIEAGQLVTIEVDAFDCEASSGWSVTVTGVAREIPAALADEPAAARCHSWLRGSIGRVFRLPTAEIEGRRLLPVASTGAPSATRSSER